MLIHYNINFTPTETKTSAAPSISTDVQMPANPVRDTLTPNQSWPMTVCRHTVGLISTSGLFALSLWLGATVLYHAGHESEHYKHLTDWDGAAVGAITGVIGYTVNWILSSVWRFAVVKNTEVTPNAEGNQALFQMSAENLQKINGKVCLVGLAVSLVNSASAYLSAELTTKENDGLESIASLWTGTGIVGVPLICCLCLCTYIAVRSGQLALGSEEDVQRQLLGNGV